MPTSRYSSGSRRRAAAAFAALGFALLASPSAHALTASEVNDAQPTAERRAVEGVDPLTLRAQVLLDRLHLSPGSIDGRLGENFGKALDVYAAANGLPAGGKLTPEIWGKLAGSYAGPVLVSYTLVESDVAGPFEPVPAGFDEMAKADALGYASAKEELAEHFHMSPGLLEALNPGVKFDRAGESIVVPAVRPEPAREAISNRNAVAARGGKAQVVLIEIDKANHALKAFDAEKRLVAFYPASIGSDEKPAPSGRFEIRAIARDPTYTYNPDYAFKGVKAREKLTIPAGPNNPVGVVWLDLTAESYGIHGTPEPERVGKSYSHGCVRLTNWDVKDLASLVGKGTVVEFSE
jgi:lipoprotein-anchoring transpeptidase ErfK/SrfK